MKERIAAVISEYSAQGVHRTGTDVDLASATWLSEKVKNLGVEPVLTEFSFNRFVYDEAELGLDGRVIAGVPLYDCPPEDSRLTGRLCTPEGEGDIAVLNAGTLAEGNPVETLRYGDRFKALIIVTPDRMPAGGIALANAERFVSSAGIPILQVANDIQTELTKAIRERTQVSLQITARTEPAQGVNVGARLKGSDEALAPLVVMTPRSGWWQCASERGGGIAAWLEIMRVLEERELPRDVLFTANTGHELGHTGYDYFISDHMDLEASAHAWLHLGANFAARGGRPRLQYSDDEIQLLARNAADIAGVGEFDEVLDSRPGGEVRAVYDAGGRYLSIVGANPLFHHPDDDWPEAVDLEMTRRYCDMLCAAAVVMAGR